jgi:hypothetical protein
MITTEELLDADGAGGPLAGAVMGPVTEVMYSSRKVTYKRLAPWARTSKSAPGQARIGWRD